MEKVYFKNRWLEYKSCQEKDQELILQLKKEQHGKRNLKIYDFIFITPSIHPIQNQTCLSPNHHLLPWSSFFEAYSQRKSPHALI